MAVDHLYYENAIEIGDMEVREIVDFALKEWQENIIPANMDHKTWHAYMYLRATQRFLLKRGCKMQFKVKEK
jgi:hypothetical protein